MAMPARPGANFVIPQTQLVLGKLETLLNPPALSSYPNQGFEWSVTRSKRLIVADAARVVPMAGTATLQEPTTVALRLTTTEFDTSPLIVPFSLSTCSTTEALPILCFELL